MGVAVSMYTVFGRSALSSSSNSRWYRDGSILLSGLPLRPGLRKWCASSMTTTSASSAIRWKRSGKSPLRPEVGVAEDREVAEVCAATEAPDVWQPSP